jgi:predicted GNAT superfamily acetyltransferase
MISSVSLRDLTTLADCRAVVKLEEAVWGADGETVPASVLLVSAKRGGILIGAWTGVDDGGAVAERLVGFVWSMPGIRDGVRTQWSHMLGVLPAFRGDRVGERLKLEQRARAIAQGAELIEWTFDPLQAANAHFNLRVLGAVGASYGIDVYGGLAGHLHRGTPTDRLIVEWWIREPHVSRRLAARAANGAGLPVRTAEVLEAPDLIRIAPEGEWMRCADVGPAGDHRRVYVAVPARFSDMQQQATELALEWRLAIRQTMTSLFERGYRAVDFELNRETGHGRYLFAC